MKYYPNQKYYPPISRSSDPISSKLTEKEITKSGIRKNQQTRVRDMVRSVPGSTSKELADFFNENRHMVARRLPEIEKLGIIRKGSIRQCSIGKRAAVTWWPMSEHQMELFG